MSAPTYRPGDIAMVDGIPCAWTEDGWAPHWHPTTEPRTNWRKREVGPVLGNVADIAANPWKALLGLLDASYPEEVFPTLTDDPARDTGPRLVSALRMVEQVREVLTDLDEFCDKYEDEDAITCGWKRAVTAIRRAVK